MAQPGTIEVDAKVLIDLSEVESARKRVRRIAAEAKDLSRDLARLEERLLGFAGNLAEHGILLELET